MDLLYRYQYTAAWVAFVGYCMLMAWLGGLPR